MSEHQTITADDLSPRVEFDHPFRVHADGTVSDSGPSLAGIHAPEVHWQQLDEYGRDIDLAGNSDWFPWSTGYTGQHGYSGPIMHASEQLAGKIATDLLGSPGVYVVCAVDVMHDDDEDCIYDSPDECTGDHPPAGWTVLRLSHLVTEDIVQCTDCFHISVNGDGNGDPDVEAAHVALMESHERTNPTPEGWAYAPGDYEWDFATFTCATCGRRHGGTWHRAHYLHPRTRVLTQHETTEWLAGRLSVTNPIETEHGVTVHEERP